jgi:outer membrane protein OmpA-like peptidoglycan-associated protein
LARDEAVFPALIDVASRGTRPLPHAGEIERSFGSGHDLSSIRTQVSGSAAGWNAFLGASASTRGDRIAFSREPSLDEAAHEAAHVVQQRNGARPPGGLSQAGDRWERDADAIAARVTRGESAADLLGEPSPRTNASDAPVQRRLIAHGTPPDVARFIAIAEVASGLQLARDPATDIVTAIGSLAAGPTSPAFAGMLTRIINDPAQDAEAQFGTHQVAPLPGGGVGGVFVGAFPIAAPTIQIIDMDDVEAVEAGAPGRGVAFLAHELEENFAAHALPPGLGSFGAAHAAGNVAEQAVAAELVAPGTELLEYLAPNPAGGTSFIEDYANYFVVVDFAAAPAPPLTSALPDNVVTGARHVPQTTVATFTIDGFATGSAAVPPAAAAVTVAAVLALLAADPTAAVHVEGFTDSVGSAASNLALGQRRADSGRALLGAGFANRIAAIGRGEVAFVAPNTTEANRALNRRIVFTVVRP